MKFNFVLASIIFSSCIFSQACAQINVGQHKKSTISTPTSTTSSSSQNKLAGFSNDQLVTALKDALTISAQNSSNKLHVADGYFKNMAIKILMPPEAQVVEEKLRQFGMGSMVDDAVLSMNRAAEKAAADAAPIFINAVKSMSITDALGIITGGSDAATQYLKKTTSSQLTSQFKPVIQSALSSVNATKYWSDVFSTYNKIPFVKPVNTDLSGYVTQKALDGLWYTIAQEELKIRTDPAAQVTSLLQSVFGH